MRLLHRLRSAWANLFHRDRVEASLDDELRAYADLLTAEYERRGYAPNDARRAALLEIGGLAQVKESTRDVWAGDAIASGFRELRYSWRSLRRSPGFLVTVVLIFALGIGVNATIFGVIDQLLFRPPRHVTAPERITLLSMSTSSTGGIGQQSFNYPVYRLLKSELGVAEEVAIAPWETLALPLGRGAGAALVRGVTVSASYFPLLGVRPERGRFFSADEDLAPNGSPVAVISDGFWTRHFQRAPDAIGQALDIGNQRFTVIGVAPDGFTGTELGRVDVWLPITASMRHIFSDADWQTNINATYAHVFIRLRPGITAAEGAKGVERVLQSAFPEEWYVKNRVARLTPLTRARTINLGTSDRLMLLLAMMAAVVLLIAIANVASLLLARALRRRREVAVRLALGASHAQLVRWILTETLLLAVLGGIGALLLAYWSGGAIRALLFGDVSWASSVLDYRVLIFSGVAVVVATLLAGMLPALETTRAELTTSLKAGARDGGGRRARARAVLIVVQVALSTMLLVGAGLFLRSLSNVSALPLGVDTDRVLSATLDMRAMGRAPEDIDLVMRTALAHIRGLPGIAHAAISTTIPFGPSLELSVRVPGRDLDPKPIAPFLNLISRDYFASLGAHVIAGRDLTDADDSNGAELVAIVSATMARLYWNGGSPLGSCVIAGDGSAPCARVVGIVEDIHRQAIVEEETPFVYFPLAQAHRLAPDLNLDQFLVVRPSGDARALIEPVRRAIQSAAPGLPYANVQRIADMPEVLSQLRQWRLGTTLFAAFGALALVLASVGLFGLISYNVASRTHEIGIRVALGGGRSSVARLVVNQALAISTTGLAAGLIMAFAGDRLIVSLLYGVSPHDPIVLGVVSLTMMIVSVLASVAPALQALAVDPLIALRAE
jgi:putative ABC transport system permease protein